MLKEIFSRNLHTESKTVCNAIITLGDIDDSGKGKRFKSRFIQPGLAGYPGQYGNVLLRKETLDKSLNTIIGAPVIINHTDVTEDNADDLRVGVISDAYYNEKDGWYWCDGVIWDETAQNLITDKNWSVSCSYDFLEQDDEGGTENNIPYDREFTKLNFVHLALVDNPRYERANIVFNSKAIVETKNNNPKAEKTLTMDNIIYNGLTEIIRTYKGKTLSKQDFQIISGLVNIFENNVQNGWVTLKGKLDEDGKPLRVFIPDYIPDAPAVMDFHTNTNKEYKGKIIYSYEHTRAKITDNNKKIIESLVNNILSNYKVEPPLKGLNVCTIGGGCLGVAVSSRTTRTISLDSSVFKENGQNAFDKSVKDGWLAKTDSDIITSVLTHELGHTITAGIDNDNFWDKIKEIKSEYLKNVKSKDIENIDYISEYARKSKDEFVAESFAQATLLKKPSKYAKMVLEEINNQFKKGSQIVQNKKDEKDQIIWIEGKGVGYCLTENDYNQREKEIKENIDKEMNK